MGDSPRDDIRHGVHGERGGRQIGDWEWGCCNCARGLFDKLCRHVWTRQSKRIKKETLRNDILGRGLARRHQNMTSPDITSHGDNGDQQADNELSGKTPVVLKEDEE